MNIAGNCDNHHIVLWPQNIVGHYVYKLIIYTNINN